MLKKKLIIWIIILLAAATAVQAQEVRVKASIDRNKILIGEPIQLRLDVEIPQNTAMGWFHLDTLPHFQFITRNAIDTQNNARTILFKQFVTITSFDSGSWVIPQLPLTVGNNRYLTDSIPVTVDYSPMDPNQPYHDIKDILEVPEADSGYINYIILAITLLAIALLIWIFWKKKKSAAPAAVAGLARSPLDQALHELNALKADQESGVTTVKTYFIRLNDILRVYFKNRQLVTAPDAGNEQFVLKVQQDLKAEQVQSLAQTLRLADAVKFARYGASVQEQQEALEVIRKTLPVIEEIHYKNPGA